MKRTARYTFIDWIGWAAFFTMIAGLYLIFMYAPTEQKMGIVQRIFYFHLPSAWVCFLSFFIVAISSALYLWKRDRKWDRIAYAAAEIGVLFCTLVLITGPIWAKPVWNVWWTWDPRLTTTLILWLMYVGYLMLRSTSESSKTPRFTAVFGIIAFLDVPLVYMSTRWWRTIHPKPVIGGEPGSSGLAPEMALTLCVCLLAFTLLYIYLMAQRISIEKLNDELEEIKQNAIESKTAR
jgi:heme exporter protein C